MSAVVKALRASSDLIDVASEHDVPTPFSVSVSESGTPILLVWTAEQWDAWRRFLDPDAVVTRHGNQLALRGTAYEFEVEVRTVLDSKREAKAHFEGLAMVP